MSSNGLALAGDTSLVLDTERMELLRKTIANGAPQLEFEMFVADCNRRGLDPFAKQTYLIKRGNRWQQQTSIDGYRLIADRTGKYAGSDEPVFDTEDANHPNKATVTVWKIVNGQRCPFTASARWNEHVALFNGKPGDTWERMPYLMLAKCAESAALRKAFPQELSGLYTNEEMQQADNMPEPGIASPEPLQRPTPTAASLVETDRNKVAARYFAIVNEKGLTEDERKILQRIAYGVESSKDLTIDQMQQLAERIQQRSLQDLRDAVKRQMDLDQAVVLPMDIAPMAQGEPGENRHTN